MELAALFSHSAHAQYEKKQSVEKTTPSRAMLEFLVEYADVDDDTFELIVSHGIEDVNEASTSDKQEQNNGRASENESSELLFDEEHSND